jgi:hypothetical protein
MLVVAPVLLVLEVSSAILLPAKVPLQRFNGLLPIKKDDDELSL